jgi:hypothetical protein
MVTGGWMQETPGGVSFFQKTPAAFLNRLAE